MVKKLLYFDCLGALCISRALHRIPCTLFSQWWPQGSRRHHRLRSDGGAALVWGFWVVKLFARDSRLASLCPVYSLKAGPDRLPSVLISSSDIPTAAAVCAAPRRKECLL